MSEQPRFLQMVINYWDPNKIDFNIHGKSLRIEVHDIQFITGLSFPREVVNLRVHGDDEGVTVNEYINSYCLPNIEKVEFKSQSSSSGA